MFAECWLETYPICVLCLVRNECRVYRIGGRRVMQVDHITPHRGDMNLFWAQDNLETLCRDCHAIAKRSHEDRGRTAWQWFARLRDEMKQHDTMRDVIECRDLIPPRVLHELITDPALLTDNVSN